MTRELGLIFIVSVAKNNDNDTLQSSTERNRTLYPSIIDRRTHGKNRNAIDSWQSRTKLDGEQLGKLQQINPNELADCCALYRKYWGNSTH